MARILFFDTETSGLDPEQNEILQLAYLVTDSKTWKIETQRNYYFSYPEDESRVSQRAIDINHLTKDFLKDQTLIERKLALSFFYTEMDSCDVVIAHNLEFDKSFIDKTAVREKVLKLSTDILWPYLYDTMKETTDLCKIPSTNGYDDYKWPKLEELAVFLNIPYDKEKLHDAVSDVELTFECFRELCEQKYVEFHEYVDGEIMGITTHEKYAGSEYFADKKEFSDNSSEIEHDGGSYKLYVEHLVLKTEMGIITPEEKDRLHVLLDIGTTYEQMHKDPRVLDAIITREELQSIIDDYERYVR